MAVARASSTGRKAHKLVNKDSVSCEGSSAKEECMGLLSNSSWVKFAVVRDPIERFVSAVSRVLRRK